MMKRIISILLVVILIVTISPVKGMALGNINVEGIRTDSKKIKDTVPTEKESSYIIKFKSKANKEDKNQIKDKIKRNNGTIKKEHAKLNAITVSMNGKALREIKNDDNIQYIEYDASFKKQEETDSIAVTWNTHDIGADIARRNGISGKGIKVAVFDTGISDHSAYKISGGVSFVSEEPTYEDLNGHGTHIAGIIAGTNNNEFEFGIAPDVQLYAVKVLDKDGYGQFSNVISAIEWATENDINIINMSFGSIVNSQLVKEAIDLAYENNILMIASAGNDGEFQGDSVMYPAAYKKVIAVGAVGEDMKKLSYSSTGSTIEVVAPGEGIYSTGLGNTYKIQSGTSMASAHVAGVASLLWSKDLSKTNGFIRGLVQQSAIKIEGDQNYYGKGLVSASSALELYDEYESTYKDGEELLRIGEKTDNIYNAEVEEQSGITENPLGNTDANTGASISEKTVPLDNSESQPVNQWVIQSVIGTNDGGGSGAELLPDNQWVPRSISYSGEEDWYSFYASVSGTYTIESSGNLDTIATLYDSAGNERGRGDDEAGYPNFKITVYMQQGWYGYVKVGTYNNSYTGNYSIKVTTPAPAFNPRTISIPYPSSLSTSVDDSISTAGEIDWFKFVVPVTGTYTMETLSNIDTFGQLYDYNLNYITQDDTSGSGTNFRITYYLQAGWTCYVKVRHFNNWGSGSYTFKLTLVDDYGNNAYSATTVSDFTNISGKFDYKGDEDYFKLTVPGTSDAEYKIYTQGTLDTFGYIYDSNMIEVVDPSDDNDIDFNFELTPVLKGGRTYYIRVRPYSSETIGNYNFRVERMRDVMVSSTGAAWYPDDSNSAVEQITYLNKAEMKAVYESTINSMFFISAKDIYNSLGTGAAGGYMAQALELPAFWAGLASTFISTFLGLEMLAISLYEKLEIKNVYDNCPEGGYVQVTMTRLTTYDPKMGISFVKYNRTYKNYNEAPYFYGPDILQGHFVDGDHSLR